LRDAYGAEKVTRPVPASSAHIKTTRHGPVAHVELSGEIDCAFREDLISGMEAVLDVPETDHVIVDMRRVELIDSTGLGVLVAANKRAKKLDIRLVFVKGPPAAHRPFELTHIDQYLTFVQL
jgi:anti-sigma B factor antagonist